MKSKRCAVIHCNNDSNSPNVSFHGLPADPLDSNEWQRFLDVANQDFIWKKTNNMLICCLHFDAKCFGSSGSRLLKHSIPTKVHGKTIVIKNPVLCNVECNKQEDLGLMLNLSTAKEWSDKLAEYATNLSICEGENILLKKKLRELADVCDEKRKKIHVLNQQTRRQEKRKNGDLIEVNSKRQRLMKTKESSMQTGFLSFEPINPGETLLKEISDRLAEPNKTYSDFLKNFSFEIHYKSPSAYSLLREKLDTKALPHPINFNRWTKHVTSDPGFITPYFDYLEKAVKDSPYKLYGALMFDEVYIRKAIIHDGDGFTGFVDYGELGDPDEPGEVATKAMFFNLTEINGHKKMPLAYALTNKLPKMSLRQMLERVLARLHMVGVRVLTITCDGLGTNFAALESMGANLKPLSPSFQTWLPHPISGEKIYIILDACHMYKLVRNLWKATTNFYYSKNRLNNDEQEISSISQVAAGDTENENLTIAIETKVISFDYIVRLQNLQTQSGLRAANKLTNRHINFENQKMKSKLCFQTFSNSVGVAVGVCRDLEIQGFEASEETQYFLDLMNRLFDALNSRSSGKGGMAPLKQNNYETWQPLFKEAKSYLLNLSYFEKKTAKIIPIVTSKKSTAIKGLFITISSLEIIMTDICFNPDEDLQYLPTWKLLQDAIELFFSLVRSRFGCNDNPNAKQLRSAVRDIICMKQKDLITGNCIAQEELTTKISPLQNLKTLVYEDDSTDLDPEEAEEVIIPQLDLPNDHASFIRTIVVYISGYAIGKLCRCVKCSSCICKLSPGENEELDDNYLLIVRRDYGGLCYPSKVVVNICTIVENHVRFWSRKGLKDMKKQKVIESSLHECTQQGLVSLLECKEERGHGLELVRNLMMIYLKARLHHLARESTACVVPTTNRNTNKKLTHFAGN